MSETKARNLLARCREYGLRKWNDPEKGERMYHALVASREMIRQVANDLGFCPCCDQPINDVKTDYTDATAIHVLYKLTRWCKEKGRHEFKSAEVKHLLDHTQYANLNHLDRFGGIVYRPINPKNGRPYKSTYYGINITRAEEFFRNERPAPVQIIANRFTGERIASTEKYLRDFPSIGEYLDEEGNYDPTHIVSDHNAVKTKPLPTVPESRQ